MQQDDRNELIARFHDVTLAVDVATDAGRAWWREYAQERWLSAAEGLRAAGYATRNCRPVVVAEALEVVVDPVYKDVYHTDGMILVVEHDPTGLDQPAADGREPDPHLWARTIFVAYPAGVVELWIIN